VLAAATHVPTLWPASLGCYSDATRRVADESFQTTVLETQSSFIPRMPHGDATQTQRNATYRIQCTNVYWILAALKPVYTMQPVVKPVVKPVWQPVVSCKRSIRKAGLHKHVQEIIHRPTWNHTAQITANDLVETSGYATWFTAGSAIRIAHYDVINDVITRKL